MTKRFPLSGLWISAVTVLVTLATAAMMTGCGRQPEEPRGDAGSWRTEKDGQGSCQEEEGRYGMEDRAGTSPVLSEQAGKSGKEDRWKKGYDLPVSDEERQEAERDCFSKLELVDNLFREYRAGEDFSDRIPEELIARAAQRLGEDGGCVLFGEPYSHMENYEKFETFLKHIKPGYKGAETIYQIQSGGAVTRQQYRYDGEDLYVIAARCERKAGNPVMTYVTCCRIREWRYTEKGWFAYELCVPQYPEVTEMIDGSCLIRVRPMTEENRRMSKACLEGLPYEGTNLLRSDWDEEHMEELDYNGLYEYLYQMRYGEKFQLEDGQEGIPEEEFEDLIMDYLPITEEKLQTWAAFDRENRIYLWDRLGCFNNSPTFFGTSVPEVTGVRENEDGTVTLTVDAVCQMILCDDAVITHELTVRFLEDGRFRYLGNKILYCGLEKIPDYQYRIPKD